MLGSTSLKLSRDSLHYYVTGDGPYKLVMLHGNSQGANTFDALIAMLPAERYQCICIELPGHGNSPPAIDPESRYSLPGYAALFIEFIDALSLQDAVFIGHSLGGHILLEAWPNLTAAAGLFIMGAPPVTDPSDLANAFLPHPGAGVFFQAEMSTEEVDAFDALLIDLPDTDAENVRLSYEMTDPTARTLLGTSIANGQFKDECSVIETSSTAIAVLAGDKDPIINFGFFKSLPTDRLWRGGVQVVPDGGHWFHIQNPTSVSALLLDYLRDCHGKDSDHHGYAQ